MHNKLIISLFAICCLISACSLPATRTQSGGERPTLALPGAPEGSLLIVDGRTVGNADQYDGEEKVLTLEEGAHEIRILHGGALLYSGKIFVSNGESHTIEINVPSTAP